METAQDQVLAPFQGFGRINGTGVEGEADDVCYICLCGSSSQQPLTAPCKCPRKVHLKCLARWQLQSAGRHEEDKCRFCFTKLPDWKSSLAPPAVKPVTPVMAIKFEGKTYKLRVQPGPEGLRQFKEQVRQLLGFDITEEFDVSFECQVPSTGEKLKLTGLSSYGAATTCAAITAAEREASKPPRSRSQARHSHPGSTSQSSRGLPAAGLSTSSLSDPVSAAASSSRSHAGYVPARASAVGLPYDTPALDMPTSSSAPLPAAATPQPRSSHTPAPSSLNPTRDLLPQGSVRATPMPAAYQSRPAPQPQAPQLWPATSSQATTWSRPTTSAVPLRASDPGAASPTLLDQPASSMTIDHHSQAAATERSSGSPAASSTVKMPVLHKASQLARKTVSKLFGGWELSLSRQR